MITFVLVVVIAAFMVKAWTRLGALETEVSGLALAIAALEQWRLRMEREARLAPARPAAPEIAPKPEVPQRPRATVPSAPPIAPPAPMPRPAPRAEEPPMVPRVAAARDAEGLEARIGSRWLLYVGVVAIIVGVAYFEKLAIENHWVTETVRVLQGGLAGFILLGAGMQFVKRGLRVYGQVLSGCGIAVLYVSSYAAFNFYQLIGLPLAFTLMSAVTALAAWLATRERSQGLAFVAVIGGFATPFLLPAAFNVQAAVFGYDAILIAGTVFLARRRDWPALYLASYFFTVLTVAAWMGAFYTAVAYLPTECFLTLFCGMFVAILATISRTHPDAKLQRAILWTAPFLYYLTSLMVLREHTQAFLVYVIALALVGAVAARRTNTRVLCAFWCAAAAPLLLWSHSSAGGAWLAAGLVTWVTVYALTLAALLEGTIVRQVEFDGAAIALLHLNGLAFFAGPYLQLDPLHKAVCSAVAGSMALLHGILGGWTMRRNRDVAVQCAALAFTLLTIAIGLQFEGAWITSGWAAEGAVMCALALRERREWLRFGGLLLFAVAIGRLVSLQFGPPAPGELVLLNSRALCGAFVVMLTFGLTRVHDRLAPPARRAIETGIGLVSTALLILSVVASEIVAYWTVRPAAPFEPIAQLVGASLLTGATLMWLGLRRQQEWMRAIGGAVVALASYALLSIQIQSAPSGGIAFFNARGTAGLLAILTLYGLARLHRRLGSHIVELEDQVAILTTGASILTLSLLTSEIDAFWAARGAAHGWSLSRESLTTMAWGGVGGFLIWNGLSRGRAWIRAVGASVLAVGIVRLLALQFAIVPAGYLVAANPRTLVSVAAIVLLYGLALRYRRETETAEKAFHPAAALWLLANALTLTWLTSEITAFWQLHDLRHATAAEATSAFAREMMLSITWASYATVLVLVGLRRAYAPIRYFAMTVFAVTIIKVFMIDLAQLDRIYRVLSVVGLGATLLLTSYLYQKLGPDQR